MERIIVNDGQGGPYDLPIAQQTRVASSGETVDVTFVLSFGGPLEAVRIALLNNQALELLGQLKAAIEQNAS